MNATVRVKGSRKVLLSSDFLNRRDTVLVVVRRKDPYTDARVVGRIVGTKIRVARSPRRGRDITTFRPTAKYWIFIAALIMHLVTTFFYSYSYIVLGHITDDATIALMIAFFYLLYRDWRIRGRIILP
jgi:hypothetical protein